MLASLQSVVVLQAPARGDLAGRLSTALEAAGAGADPRGGEVMEFRFCPKCGAKLEKKALHGKERPACAAEGCGFVHWGNPTPVVAAIVEHEGNVLLARGRGWPEKMFGLITGFLEAGEAPEAGVLREVKEELSLDGDIVSLVGVYPFEMRNELIVAYHVKATGTVALSEELEAVKPVPPEKLRAWPFGTGLAVQAWLEARARSSRG